MRDKVRRSALTLPSGLWSISFHFFQSQLRCWEPKNTDINDPLSICLWVKIDVTHLLSLVSWQHLICNPEKIATTARDVSPLPLSLWSKGGMEVKSCEFLWPILILDESFLPLTQGKEEESNRKWHALPPVQTSSTAREKEGGGVYEDLELADTSAFLTRGWSDNL